MEILDTLRCCKFINALDFGDVFLVGGIVRDGFLGKKSKDIDLLVTGIEIKEIEKILSDFGEVNLVGESFGVLKFNPDELNLDEPIDIAIPRTEKSTGPGHRDFEIIADHTLSVKDDLQRRDFTCNAIAQNVFTGEFIDPFGGIMDIAESKLVMLSDTTFLEDPLRMLRGIQFGARFGFFFDLKTFNSIVDNRHTIREISGERILIELNKIFDKGDHSVGLFDMHGTGLFEEIFGRPRLLPNIIHAKTRADFFFIFTNGMPTKFKTVLKGDIDTFREIEAIHDVLDAFEASNDPIKWKMVIFNKIKKAPGILNSGLLPEDMDHIIDEFKTGKIPKTMKDLTINGDDLKQLGFKDKSIGAALNRCIFNVMSETCVNEREALIIKLKEDNI